MTQRNNGLGDWPRLTESSLKQAVQETVVALKGTEHSETDLADAWGVSTGTVGNAINQNHALSSVPLLKLGQAFGPSALNTVLALIGAKAVPLAAITLSEDQIAAIPCNVASTVPTLIRLLADGDASDADVRQLDREGVIDCFSQLADMLMQRRDTLRLKPRSVA